MIWRLTATYKKVIGAMAEENVHIVPTIPVVKRDKDISHYERQEHSLVVSKKIQ